MNDETKTTLRIPNDLKEKLKAESERQHRSLHNLIISVLYEYADGLSSQTDTSSEKSH